MGSFRGRVSRPLHFFRYRILSIAILLCILQQQRLFYSYQAALSAKYSPTYFGDDVKLRGELPGVVVVATGDEEGTTTTTSLQDELLANREAWDVVGAGWEGTVYRYQDVVIKTFKVGQSPLRNCVKDEEEDEVRWPTEIPATVYFGAMGFSGPSLNLTSDDALITRGGFLPVRAYFQAAPRPSTSAAAEWHLVTPLIPGGTLKTLAKQIRSSSSSSEEAPPSFRALDAQYRPTFDRLLLTLDAMHREGYCHDDIKPGNVLADETPRHWVLGDLGNVRHVSHPYHASRIWTENAQAADCRANDAVRLLKTYLYFVRRAAGDPERFDDALLAREGPLGRLFGHVVAKKTRGLSARRVRVVSLSEAPSREDDTTTQQHPSRFQRWFECVPFSSPRAVWRRRAVDEALRTSVSEATARFWAVTWLFKIPGTPC